ncbi:uncharacterized protein K452DRAFT_100166 [Aplosporella prunicola CBS 121167]|uniref:GRAM domain-containing protein n=1 Tax=Aplosporella prunicola CBS 121167 TaxID=1176127 RepID=A0A6A6B225_9PEZI|nr:uncharacterized protein K452DRAFT_100166 [Aplosporella prunicola CBS 121167]KAF2137638.1 hypothetical protein K452DRAFT_100166 [Aplosporella prunicola CBS 121167]
MSINWVMLSENEGFTPLPGEQRLYTSPPRTTLSLRSLNKYPGKEPFSVQSSTGCLHLTNRRIVYLPMHPTEQLQSFAAPILNLHDTHVTAPFFGPNVWSAIVQPVPGGNIPAVHPALELKFTFKDGGAFDFHTTFERIKERLQQAVEVAREHGSFTGDGSEGGTGRGPGALAGINMNNVHLEQLPAYEPPPASAAPPAPSTPPYTEARDGTSSPSGEAAAAATEAAQKPQDQPTEPPPGYEEVQMESVNEEMERRMRTES